VLQLFDLRQVGGVDEQKSRTGAGQRRQQHQQPEQDATDDLSSGYFLYRWKVLIDHLHAESGSG